MTEAGEKLKEQIAALPETDRDELIDFILATLPENTEDDPEWEAELDRRRAEIESGEVPGIPAEEVFERLRQKYS